MKDKFLTFNVQTFTLSNGLKVSLIPKNTYVYYGQLDIPLGSYHLNYQLNDQKYTLIPGVAHFLEHQAFLDETGDSFKTLSSLGIYTNALTSYRQTSYLIHGKDHFFDGLAILLKAIDTPYFIDQAIENEKKIIQEEIKMYQDETDYQIQNKLYQNMLFKHPLQHDILGNIDDIDCITKDDLYRTYHHFYLSAKKHLILA